MTHRAVEGFSTLPEVGQPNRRRNSASDKQVAAGDGPETCNPHVEKEAVWAANPSEHEQQAEPLMTSNEPMRRARKRGLCIALVLIVVIILGVGLGAGLGVGLRGQGSNTKSNAANETQSSDTGVFQRTGLAVCSMKSDLGWQWLSQSGRNQTSLFLIYQTSSGAIRYMYTAPENLWQGGTSSETVATDASNGTTLTARCQPGRIDLFYTNQDHIVQQRSITNLTSVWSDGPLNDLNVRAWDSIDAGMTANFYAGSVGDQVQPTPFTGTRLWVAVDSTTFNQYSWAPGLPRWHYDLNWPNMNATASPASYGWSSGHTSYAFFVNEQDDGVLYWFDSAVDKISTTTHPLNVWTQATVTIPSVDPSAGLTYHGNLWGRVAGTNTFHGWNMTFAAENSTIIPSQLSEASGPSGITAGRFAVAADLPNNPNYVYIFYQSPEDDIYMSTGITATGQWNSTRLPVPND